MMNINDVARLAGVSSTTVSRVINNSETVGLDIKLRVEAIIRNLGFKPDPYAQYLGKKSKIKSRNWNEQEG